MFDPFIASDLTEDGVIVVIIGDDVDIELVGGCTERSEPLGGDVLPRDDRVGVAVDDEAAIVGEDEAMMLSEMKLTGEMADAESWAAGGQSHAPAIALEEREGVKILLRQELIGVGERAVEVQDNKFHEKNRIKMLTDKSIKSRRAAQERGRKSDN